MTTVNTYPFDPTGTAISNKIVNEEQILTAANSRDFHFVIPSSAPFFHQGLIVRHAQSARVLTEGVDYVLGYQFVKASRAVAKPVYGAIIFYDRSLVGVVQITYQTIGGEWTLSPLKIAEIMANRSVNPRVTTWEQVADQPDRFPPIDHEWDVDDLVGMTEVVASLNSIALAIRQGADETALAHFTNYQNPHQTTKEQVGLGLVENLPRSDTATAVAGTSNNAYMTPKTTASAIDARAGAMLASHTQDRSNPHQVDKGQVGLGSVQNFGVANDQQAEAALAADLYMTPRATRLAVQAIIGVQLAGHLADYDNPHRTTKAQIGLADVLNYGVANDQESADGVVNNKYMTPYATKLAINAQAVTIVNAHAGRTDNPHNTTKAHVGLGNVPNFSMATNQEAIDGLVGDKFMSPSLVKLAIQQLASDNIGAHVGNYNNPHQVTAAQVGSYTTAEVDALLDQYLPLNGTASNSSKLGGKTLQEVIDQITGSSIDAATLGGQSLTEIYDAVETMTVANAGRLEGFTKAELTTLIAQEASSDKINYKLYPAPAQAAPYYTQVATIPYYPNNSLVADTDKKLLITGVEQATAKNGGLYLVRLSMKKDTNMVSTDKDSFLQVIQSISPTLPDDCEFGYILVPDLQRIELWVKSPTPRSNMVVVDLTPEIGALTPEEPTYTVQPENIVYVQKQSFVTNLDLAGAFDEVFADMLDVMLVITNFISAPQNLMTTKYASLPDIKTEYVVALDRNMFRNRVGSQYDYVFVDNTGPLGNYMAIENGAGAAGVRPQIAGTTFVNDSPMKLMWDAGGQAIAGDWTNGSYDGKNYFKCGFQIDALTAGHPNYLALPELVEVKYPHTAALGGNYTLLSGGCSDPYRMYGFFQPMDGVDSTYKFVDNLGFPGALEFAIQLRSRTDDVKAVRAFVGLIKRSAVGKKAQDLLDSDIVLGVIGNGASGKFIVNGVAVWTRNSVPTNSTDYELVGKVNFSIKYNAIEYTSIADAMTAGATLEQMKEGLQVQINEAWVCGNAADKTANEPNFITSGSIATTYPVDLSTAALAILVDNSHMQDAAGQLRGENPTASGSIITYIGYDRPALSGRFYPTL